MPNCPRPATPSGTGSDTLPGVPELRGVPRRAWLPRMLDDSPSCGWFESSQALSQGLAVTEWALDEALLLFAAPVALLPSPALAGCGRGVGASVVASPH